MTQLKVLNGYTAQARFLATCEPGVDGTAAHVGWVPMPGTGNVTAPVMRWEGQPVVMREIHRLRGDGGSERCEH